MPSKRLLVLLGALMILVAGCAGGSASESTAAPHQTTAPPAATTTTVPSTTTTTSLSAQEEAEALAMVEAAFEAFNSGDIEGWVAARGVREDGWVRTARVPYTEALLAAGAHIEVEQCTSNGHGDLDGSGAYVGYHIICDASESNLFYQAASIGEAVTFEWVVDEGEIIYSSADEADFDNWLAFNKDFKDWMQSSHADVFGEMSFLVLTSSFPSAESMPTALEYVEEFVSESEDWPREASA